ncbi:MAG: DUF3149 domain-containing protein [Betaproteobacteria bacterium]|nr:DUF3149 domain-containing protein [Betaproteobacteria bacterium]
MLKILFGSPIGILSLATVLGSVLVVGFWVIYWARHQSK